MPVATGNWGCGSRLKGDPQLKLVIQWLAASLAGVPRLIYYTSGNPSLSKVMCERNLSYPINLNVETPSLNSLRVSSPIIKW